MRNAFEGQLSKGAAFNIPLKSIKQFKEEVKK